MDNLMVFFFTTNKCSKGCDHCYNLSIDDGMTRGVADQSVRWLKRICIEENVKHLRVSFLGGEPLNTFDMVIYLVDQMHEKIEWVTPMPPDGHILHTNGDLLTDDMLKGLKSRRIKIALNPTYDTLEEVEKKIIHIKSVCRGCTLSIALNDFNMPRITDLARLAVKHHCQMRINRLYDGGKNLAYVNEYKNQMSEVLDILLSSEKPLWPNWIMESTYPTWEGPKNPYSCGRWLVIITPDGTLRSCNPDYDTKVGSIYTHLHWKELKFPQRWSAKNLPECQGCEWITWCQGGCPYSRKLAYGTYDKRTPFCSAFKQLFPKLMLLKDRWITYERRIENE
jgi:radical SAM protein with 4Fe4S-binding SPASM domain